MIPRKVGLGGLGKGVRRPLLFRLKAQNQKPATWVSPLSRFRDSLPPRHWRAARHRALGITASELRWKMPLGRLTARAPPSSPPARRSLPRVRLLHGPLPK